MISQSFPLLYQLELLDLFEERETITRINFDLIANMKNRNIKVNEAAKNISTFRLYKCTLNVEDCIDK